MRIHCLQHASFEGLAAIEGWTGEKRHTVNYTRLYLNEPFPAADEFDMLIVMGGPMSFDDYDTCTWLHDETTFIKKAIDAGKKVLGICLGSQLIANAIDGSAKHGKVKEIGWYPVSFENLEKYTGLDAFPNRFMTFHWHGDTFDIPAGATRIASSEATPNQGYIYKNNVIGLQFHFEMTKTSLEELIERCKDDLTKGPWVQGEEDIKKGFDNLEANNRLLWKIMDYLAMA